MNNLQYIRTHYNIPVRRGGHVYVYNQNGTSYQSGTITGATEHGSIRIRLDGERTSKPYHPKDSCLRYDFSKRP